MVRKGTSLDEFDNIKFERVQNAEIIIGNNYETSYVEIELYDKNLVLTSKWDKLPVLEKINTSPYGNADLADSMEASGLNVLVASFTIYNCEYDDIDDDHIIDQYIIVASQDAGVLYLFSLDHAEADFNIPLRNKITIVRNVSGNANVATAAFPADRVGIRFMLNIDYVKYSPEQLKDWILKEIFIDQ